MSFHEESSKAIQLLIIKTCSENFENTFNDRLIKKILFQISMILLTAFIYIIYHSWAHVEAINACQHNHICRRSIFHIS